MHTTIEPQDRIAELEDALKENERRLQELKADLDKANDLIERQREHVQDCRDVIEAWKEAFDMRPSDSGGWTWAPWVADGERWRDDYGALVRKWNRHVEDFNAMYRRRKNVGRPLLASDAQRATVLKLRNAGMSLRAIAEETSLGLNTVRTIVDQRDGVDRTTRKYVARIRRNMGEERTWQSRKRIRDSLPRRIATLQKQSAELQKEAKGLK
jgi:Helix-turn-helix domain of resolvase